MKKQFYLLAAGLLAVCIANAQIKKGDMLLGGSLGFNSQNIKPDGPANNSTAINVSPSFGIATKDNLLVGFNLVYSHIKSDNAQSPTQRADAYGAGFFVRRYKLLGSGFSLFGEGNFMGTYNHQKNYYYPGASDSKGYSLNLGFYPGVAYAISPHVQLETGFQNLAYAQYGHTKTTGGTADVKENDFRLGAGLSSSLGGFVVGFKWLLN